MIVMGIDASTSSTGWSIFKGNKLIDYGVIKPKGGDWRDRIQKQWLPLCEIIDKYKPEKIYTEDIPLKDGKITILKLGAVQGIILGVATCKNIPIGFLSPSDWRGALIMYDGTREGTKREVLKKKAIEMANKNFGLNLLWVAPKSTRNEDDAAEAILIAYSQVRKRHIGKNSH